MLKNCNKLRFATLGTLKWVEKNSIPLSILDSNNPLADLEPK